MLSKKQRRQCLSVAENVALLSLLRLAPTTAQTNQPPQSVVDDSGRLLSFETEVSLTNTFAFLCGISDDPSHVIATCVEESTDRRGIQVVVAINKERPASGNEVLERIKNGLEEIFRRLARANREEDVLEDLVLDAIVDMCKQRIFSRIQSQRSDATYRKTGKAFLGSVIEQVLDAVRKHRTRGRFGSEVEAFIKGAVRLQDSLTRLEKCQEKDAVACIKDVLSAAHRVNKTTDFDKIFQEFSSKDLNPKTQQGFELRLGKLANYRECALYLLRTAKLSVLFKKADVKLVSLDGDLFKRDLTVPPDCHISSCLSRCDSGSSTAFGAKKITSRLMDLNRNNEKFRWAVQKILRESRVHAEVQIVCHYELHPAVTKPRVICSSKDACYLCNLFIQLHGTFHIPRTHGNLYPGWRLLPIPSLNRVQAQLNKALEARIRGVVGDIMIAENRSLMLSLNENESTVFSFSTALPTNATSAIVAETSGSGATKARRTEQGSLRQGEGASPPGFSGKAVPLATTTETCHPTSPDSSIFTEGPQTNPKSQPGSPKPSSQKFPGPPLSRPATPGNCGESSKEAPGSDEEHDKVAKTQIKYPSMAGKDGTLEQVLPESELESKGKAETAPEPKPDPRPTPSPHLQSQHTPTPNHEQELGPEPTRSLEPASELPPARDSEMGSDLAMLTLNPEPVPLLTPEPNQAQDPKASPNPTPPIPSSIPAQRPKPPRHLHLERDKLLSIRLDITTATRNETIPAITAGQITIVPELIRSLGQQSRSVVEVRVHRLPQRRAAAFYAARPRGFVDLERCDDGVEIDGGSSESVYIAYGGEVVVLDVARVQPNEGIS